METFSASQAICVGNSPVPGEFPAQRPVTRSFDVFFDLHPNKWGWGGGGGGYLDVLGPENHRYFADEIFKYVRENKVFVFPRKLH